MTGVYSTAELTSDTLHDFEGIMNRRPAPGAFSCWCLYHHRTGPPDERGVSKAGRASRNKKEKRRLVETGKSHGIIVYHDDVPVGWCQFGTIEELPRLSNQGGYRRLTVEGGPDRVWRITCFVVDEAHRRRGVAGLALRAAIQGIERRGGGLVEAFPIARWGAYRDYLGTESMFRKEGFRTVARFGASNLLMRKRV